MTRALATLVTALLSACALPEQPNSVEIVAVTQERGLQLVQVHYRLFTHNAATLSLSFCGANRGPVAVTSVSRGAGDITIGAPVEVPRCVAVHMETAELSLASEML